MVSWFLYTQNDVFGTNIRIREGKDGPWGTFHIHVGTPPQTISVLPGTLLSEPWLAYPESCMPVTNCTADNSFKMNKSSTWNFFSPWNVGPVITPRLNITGSGLYGQDTVSVDLATGGGISAANDLLIAVSTKNYDLGWLPLKPTIPKMFDRASYSSFFDALNASSKITSRTYGYTAGAYNSEYH
jgi:hypothetical protein